MSGAYFRPIIARDPALGGKPLAGGWARFAHVEILRRDGSAEVVSAEDLPEGVLTRLTEARAPIAGMGLDRPRLMGIVNATPDSFSDGGQFETTETAVAQGARLIAQGADMVDVGGESTRPGAAFVSAAEELTRVLPVIEALAARGDVPVSVDTRKPEVAREAVAAGAGLFNDVSALSFAAESVTEAASLGVPVCLMHASGDPKTMQDNPQYENVLLDVYDYLEGRVQACEAAGIARSDIVIDPGIGFGKTVAHNLALISGLSLFHGLGCAILLGASRKRFIGTLGGAEDAQDRVAGSIAVGLEALAQGVQILRVHDMAETKQAMRLWQALQDGTSR